MVTIDIATSRLTVGIANCRGTITSYLVDVAIPANTMYMYDINELDLQSDGPNSEIRIIIIREYIILYLIFKFLFLFLFL